MIGKILGTRPHLSGSACVSGQDPFAAILELLGRLIAERVPINLASLCGVESRQHRRAGGPDHSGSRRRTPVPGPQTG